MHFFGSGGSHRLKALRTAGALLAASLISICGLGSALAQNPPVYQYASAALIGGSSVTGTGGEGCVAPTVNPSPIPPKSQDIGNQIQSCTVGSSLSQNQSLTGSEGPTSMTGTAMQSATPAQVTASVTIGSLTNVDSAFAQSVSYYYQDGLPAVAGQTLNLKFLVLGSVTNQGLQSEITIAATSDGITQQDQLTGPLTPFVMTLSPLLIGASGKFSISVNVKVIQNGGPGTDSLTVLLGCSQPITGVVFACDPTIYNNLPGGVCDTLNSTVASLYNNAFTNANACIYVQTGSASLGQTVSQENTVPYSSYRSALVSAQSDANDLTALTYTVLPTNPYGSQSVQITNPLARALGISATTGIQTNGQTPCSLGTAGCYDAVITISNSIPLFFRSGSITGSQYDFYTIVQRQTDEVLGTASCSPGTSCGGRVAPADFFRYHSNGARSFSTGSNDSCTSSDSTNACFSIDGIHMLQQYNNLSNGQPTGDWVSNCAATPLVQEAAGCPGVAGTNISPTAEMLALDVVGYGLSLTSITVQTSPSGLQFSVDGGQPQTAPQTLSLSPGSHTIAVAPTQAGGPGMQYAFTGWSDGGAASHSITAVSNSAATYTASFNTQYQLSVAASPAAGGTVTPASGTFYNSGTAAAVTATPNSGYVFNSWSGPVDNASSASTTMTMSAPESVTANFSQVTGITIQTSPAGLLFSVDSGNMLTAPQTVSLSPGSHTITVSPTQQGAAGTQYVFSGWSDSGSASHAITVTASAATYTATFNTQYQLTISPSPAAGGTVTPASGTFYTSGTVVPISATANAGYTFSGWSGAVASAGSASTTITMSAPENIAGNFSSLTGITIQTSPVGLQFSVDGGAAQTAPQTLTLSQGAHTITVAATEPGATGTQYVFTGWSDSGGTSHSITVTNAAATYTASFKTQYQLTISASPAAGGVVTPASGAFYDTAASVLITTTANTGYSFTGWTGSVASPSSPATSVTMSAAETVVANFTSGQAPPAVTVFSPSQGATGVATTASLTWGGSAGATSYNIYFGTSFPPPLVTSVTGTSYSPTMIASTMYYWEVAATNATGSTPSAVWSFTTAAVPSGYRFIPVTPCRVMDTRGATGAFGGPSIAAGTTRNVQVPLSACNIPATAQAYSLNVTVAPPGQLTYLSIWPTGQTQPVVSTLNSLDGRIVANAAIVPAGTNGAISLYVSNTTDVIIDINGYFAPASTSGSMSFYAATPCRVVDTRGATGAFGGPFMSSGSTRTFTIPSSPCGVPATAQAYSLNVTAVPHASLPYLTTWPTGQSQPLVSTLNSIDGSIVANAAIVPAGTGGAISLYVAGDTDVIIDINGYFAPAGSTGALSLYTLTPCRIVDTRGATGAFGGPGLAANGARTFAIPSSGCNVPSTAQAYSLNVTAVPPAQLVYLTAWPTGQTQPVVSTLNSMAGKIVANAAIVPAGASGPGGVSIFVSNATDVILDINAYFAQ